MKWRKERAKVLASLIVQGIVALAFLYVLIVMVFAQHH